MKNKLITHSDLDGVGCAILFKTVYPDGNIQYMRPDNINKKINKWLDEETYKYFDKVVITDLSVDEKTAYKIDSLIKENRLNLTIIDHHDSASELANKYDWFYEIGETNGYTQSATSLFYFYLLNHIDSTQKFKVSILNGYSNMVEAIRLYDTWEWVNDKSNPAPSQLNDLLWLTGRERFIHRFLTNSEIYPLSTAESTLLSKNDEDKTKYLNRTLKYDVTYDYDFGGNLVTIVNAHQFINELGSAILESDDFKMRKSKVVAMINFPMTISLRSDDNKSAEELAIKLGGGGHEDSAGIPIIQNEKVIKPVLDYYSKVLNKEL